MRTIRRRRAGCPREVNKQGRSSTVLALLYHRAVYKFPITLSPVAFLPGGGASDNTQQIAASMFERAGGRPLLPRDPYGMGEKPSGFRMISNHVKQS